MVRQREGQHDQADRAHRQRRQQVPVHVACMTNDQLTRSVPDTSRQSTAAFEWRSPSEMHRMPTCALGMRCVQVRG